MTTSSEPAEPDELSADPREQIVLRILAGSQRGASMPLRATSYVVGKGDDSDIVLADDSLSASHARLTVSNGALTLEALEGAVFFNDGVLGPGERVALELPVALSMGLIVVAVGVPSTDWTGLPVTKPWPLDDAEDVEPSADAPESENRVAAVAGDAETDTTEPSRSDADTDGPGDPEAAPAAGPDADGLSQREPPLAEIPLPRKCLVLLRRYRVLFAGSLVAAAVVCAAALMALEPARSMPEPAVQTPAAANPQASIADAEAIANRLSLEEVSFDPAGDGSVTVTGFVPTAENRRRLRGALAEAGLTYSDRTHVVEQLLALVRESLGASTWHQANFADHLVVTYHGNGEIDIDGFLGPQVDKGDLRRRLQSDVPGIGTLRFTRSDVRDWIDVLDQRIEDAGLSLWLKSAEDGARIRVAGQLNPTQAVTWRRVGKAFVRESRGWPKLTIDVTASRQAPIVAKPTPQPEPAKKPEPAEEPVQSVIRPNLSVIGVILSDGKPDHVLLATGETFAEGDVLDGGATVGKIEMDQITIKKGGQVFVYRVKGG